MDYKVEGVVLRRRALGEADDIVTLLSPTRGRLDAVAKGVRKSKRSTSGRLEPFNQVQLLVAQGRSLDIISQAQVLRARPAMTADLDRLARGLYVLELFDRIAEADASDRLFRSLVRSLDELETVDVDLASRRAELRLLTVLGCAPQLEVCIHCGGGDELSTFETFFPTALTPIPHEVSDARAPTRRVGLTFSVEGGGFVCATCRGVAGALRQVSRACRALVLSLRAPHIEDASHCWSQFPPGPKREAEGLLSAHLDWHWPTRMRSRRFLDTLQRMPADERS